MKLFVNKSLLGLLKQNSSEFSLLYLIIAVCVVFRWFITAAGRPGISAAGLWSTTKIERFVSVTQTFLKIWQQ